MEPTIGSIIASSHLPLSIIIVGIGNEDFSNMTILDGDNGLFDSKYLNYLVHVLFDKIKIYINILILICIKIYVINIYVMQ